MSFRKEKKFKVSISDGLVLIAELQKKGMKNLFKKRMIHSQYFDTRDFKMLFESEEGLLPRNKIRVRWYDSDFESLNLEKKVSSIEGRYKILNKISLDKFKVIKKNGLNDLHYGLLLPSALISYEREYFIYENVRITFDSNIKYLINSKNIPAKDSFRVIEVKVPMHITEDYLEKIIPIPTSRFSKYSRAFFHVLKNESLSG